MERQFRETIDLKNPTQVEPIYVI